MDQIGQFVARQFDFQGEPNIYYGMVIQFLPADGEDPWDSWRILYHDGEKTKEYKEVLEKGKRLYIEDPPDAATLERLTNALEEWHEKANAASLLAALRHGASSTSGTTGPSLVVSFT